MLVSVQLRMENRFFGRDIPMRLTAAEGGCFFPFPFFEAIATELIFRSILRRVNSYFKSESLRRVRRAEVRIGGCLFTLV
jgi:hypothetical protein